MKEQIEKEFNDHLQTASKIHTLSDEVFSATQICLKCLKNGGKILLFGNGGSASDAQHIAAELVGRYKTERKGLPAIALSTDTSVITSISNDFGYNKIFHRQIEAIAKKDDVVIGISTSGKSENVISGLELATNLGCQTIGFSGDDSSLMKRFCNVNIAIPSKNTPRIQEMHILIGHTICHLIDLS